MTKNTDKTAKLVENRVIVENSRLRDRLIQKGFGEISERKLLLGLEEAIYLAEKEKIEIKKSTRKISADKLLELACGEEKKFYPKYIVFRDLRDKGYVVKTGYKFGFDLRVYPKGKKPGEAHTQWVLNIAVQESQFSMPEISRMVRLSGNINTTILQAVVDAENGINYYEIKRVLP